MPIDAKKDFGTRECPSCATEVKANHNRCPICGYDFPHPGPARKVLWPVVAVILLLIILSWYIR